jgi:hypothetical protein
MVEAVGLAFASLVVPLVAFVVVSQGMDFAKWVRRKGWREPKERIEEADAPRR